MTRFNPGTYSLFLVIILWGVLLGGIVYSHIVYFPPYLSDLPNSAVIVTGKYALTEGRFWMLIHPLLILSLIASVAVNWKFRERRKLLLTSFGIYVVVLIVTFSYFLPELGAFHESAQSNITPTEWLARGNRWQYLSWIRGATMFAAFIPLLVALTKSNDSEKTLS